MSAALPPLTPSEQRIYSRMAETMTYYHNHFKSTYALLYSACSSNARPAGMSIAAFLRTAADFVQNLEMHHGIEEAHIYPLLGQRMPAFRDEKDLLGQHKMIHEGLDKLEEYVKDCKRGKRELRLGEMKGLLEGFGETLGKHLDEEVENLGAQEMRKYWSLEEMKGMPM